MRPRESHISMVAFLCAVSASGCGEILGIDAIELYGAGGSVGDPTTTAGSGTDSTGHGGAGESGTGGDASGGTGGGASGGAGGCTAVSLEVCNGVDDDCDGQTDEDLDSITCGVGACEVTVPSCHDGTPQECPPGEPSMEMCNGVDDDCDGQTDEDLGSETCGLGACAVTVDTCVDGAPQQCVPGTPQSEVCNGADDDCNGQTDDGLGTTSCGLGACAVTVENCSNGAPQQCVPGTPKSEACNGVDDDCDGQSDDGLGTISCGIGACQVTVQSCANGAPQQCVPGTPKSEACNGVDDDCDGSIDESNPGGGGACTVPGKLGVCAQGTLACTGGTLKCVGPSPTTEVCNGKDDDCDGTVDDGNPGGGTCTVAGKLGICATGTKVCSGGALTCVGNSASAEVCNGSDDDCDGYTDEVAGNAFKIPFPSSLSCNGVTQTNTAPVSTACGSYIGIPVVTSYPGADNDLAWSLGWSLGSNPPTVSVNCHSAGASTLSGYLAVVAVPSSTVGKVLATDYSMSTSAICDQGSVSLPALDTGTYPHFIRFPAVHEVWLPSGDHNDDSQWFLEVSANGANASYWFNGDNGSDKFEGRIAQLGYKSDWINEKSGCLAGTGTWVVTVPKPTFGSPGKKFLPLFSVPSFLDDVGTCAQPAACQDNTDDEHGFNVTISGENDPAASSVTFTISQNSEASNTMKYHAAVLAYD